MYLVGEAMEISRISGGVAWLQKNSSAPLGGPGSCGLASQPWPGRALVERRNRHAAHHWEARLEKELKLKNQKYFAPNLRKQVDGFNMRARPFGALSKINETPTIVVNRAIREEPI